MTLQLRRRLEPGKGARVYAAPIGPVKPIIPQGMIMLMPDERLTALQLTAVVAARYGVTPRQVFSRQQARVIQLARAETVRQVHQAMRWSLRGTAEFFGIDHKAVERHIERGRA